MSLLKGFRDFVLRGNVVDLAVGVVIGGAFGKVVGSMVKDVITPLIGAVFSQPDFSEIKLGPIMVGNFLNEMVAFLIIAAVVYFGVVVPMNRMLAIVNKPEAPSAPPPLTTDQALLSEIRDLLKKS